jgi:hypothetical protein
MKRFLFLCALPLVGCNQSFFIQVDLGLNGQDLNTIALNAAQLREIQVEAIPENGTAPTSFTISNGNLIDLQAGTGSSYVLELPAELEGVPIKLVHKGFPVESTINAPVLFGEITAITKQGEINGAQLSVKDPQCNTLPDPTDFCFGVKTTDSISTNHNHMIATNTNVGNQPVVLIIDNSAQALKSLSVKPDGSITTLPGAGIPFPDGAATTVLDISLLAANPNGVDFSVAILQGSQIFTRTNNDATAQVISAPGAKAITSVDLSNAPGGRDIAAITNNSVVGFIANNTNFDLPRDAVIAASDGAPALIGTRRGNQIGVVTSGQSSNLLFFDFIAGTNLHPLSTVPLPNGVLPVDVAFGDLDNDGNEDAVILDDGPTKRLLYLFLESDGRLKPDGLLEVPLGGTLKALSIGHFDNNGSNDVAVSGEALGSFVQFVLSSNEGPQVTAPRVTKLDPNFLVPVRIGGASQADTLVVETTRVSSFDVFVPEI